MINRSLLFSSGIIILLSIVTYSNTFKVPFQFDDEPNILHNTVIHIQKLDRKSITQTFFSNPSSPNTIGSKLNRPVAYFSFALNWYFGKDAVWGYHAVNLVLHIATSLFLYGITLKLILLKRENLTIYQYRTAISMVSVLLWCLNPIQTQAVTYIVQRMAILTAFFYLAGIYFYLKVKESKSPSSRIIYLLFAVISYVMAVGSKENAVILPFAILLIEVVFYDNNWIQSFASQKKVVSLILISGVLMGGVLFLATPLSKILDGYEGRPFSLSERIITQPRIIIFYLSLLFLPFSHRFSIDHDVVISKGLLWPWTTIPSLLCIFILLVTVFLKRDRYPFFYFASLFYFLNHLIESSILPLEMIFEHRNYLPSLFLFLPIATLLIKLFVYAQNQNKRMAVFSLLLIGVIILFFSVNTFNRNKKWKTVDSLWEDARTKAPSNARSVLHLAWQKAYGPNADPEMYDSALSLYKRALQLKFSTKQLNLTILDNMAGIYVRQKKYQKAVDSLLELLKSDPDYQKGRMGLVQTLIRMDRYDDALLNINYLLSLHSDKKEYLNLKGHILLRKKSWKEALHWFHKSNDLNDNHWKTFYYIGVTYSEMKMYDNAEEMLIKAFSQKRDHGIYLSFIQNMLLSGKMDEADKMLKEFSLKFEFNEMIAYIKSHEMDSLSIQPTFQPLLNRVMIKK